MLQILTENSGKKMLSIDVSMYTFPLGKIHAYIFTYKLYKQNHTNMYKQSIYSKKKCSLLAHRQP